MPRPATIREAAASDSAAIHAVHCAAFPTDAEARLVDRLGAAGRLALSLVAVVDDSVVGHVAFSPVAIDGESVGLGLAPVAVTPERQRSGVGSDLIRRGLELCRANDEPLVVVLGEPAYYSRFGFVPASDFGLRDAYGGGDAFQVVLLRADAPVKTGLVEYAPEFAALA